MIVLKFSSEYEGAIADDANQRIDLFAEILLYYAFRKAPRKAPQSP
jgi:hypothetical protein